MLKEDGLFLDKNHELYNLLVPDTNKLRRLLDLSDFTFVFDELRDKYCLNNGRNATSPILLFKYLILKVVYGLSDVDVVERTRYDLSFKYFLNLDPMETKLIHPATLTKFRRLRLGDSELLNQLLAESIKIAHKHKVINSECIIIDSTHTGSRYNYKSPREVLIEQAKLLRQKIYAFNPEMKEQFPTKISSGIIEDHISYCTKLCDVIESNEPLLRVPVIAEQYNVLRELVEDNNFYLKQSYDNDAKIGHKSADTNFFGYKTHIAINEERLVTAAVVTSGEKNDGKQLKELIEQSKNNGVIVNEVIGDGAYSELTHIEYAKENTIKLVSKLSKTVINGNGNNDWRSQFTYNKDADLYTCPAGHLSIRKQKTNVKSNGITYPNMTYFFDVSQCQLCSMRAGCYKDGAKTKSFSISIKKEEFKDHIEFMESEYFKFRMRERYKIEAVNAHLKNNYGYRTSTSRGLLGMNIQAATTLFVNNLERILRLRELK